MAVNYDDKRLTEVKNDEAKALTDLEKTYGDMISDSEDYYKAQIDASKNYAETQKKNQQAQTDFTIDTIEQQKEQAEKDYIKEQSGAYVDWQKQSNQYGANAERMASMGMTGTGYSESSQVSMYNTYQNRVATAREAYTRAVLDYDNAIKEAQLQNNSVLAEIAYQALQQQLELSLQGFQYKNTLILEKANQKRAIQNDYFTRWKAVLDQINTENALAEQQRQFNQQMAFEREKFNWTKEQANKSSGGGSGGGGSINKGSSSGSKGSGTVSTKSSGSGNKPSYQSIESAAINMAQKTHSNKSVASYLDSEVKKGNLTEAQADSIYAKSYKLINSSWTLSDDGGINWFGGIDNNTKVKDEMGNEYTLKELKNALIKQGYSKDYATKYVKSLQSRLDK